MHDPASIEQLEARARWEAAHGRPMFAFRLYMEAWKRIKCDPQRASADGSRVLNGALDLAIDYTPKKAQERDEAASELLGITQNGDARALVTRGVFQSMAARDLWEKGDTLAAKQKADEAVSDLEAATKIIPFDADAWGSLGGVYKRMRDWAREEQRKEDAKRYAKEMLAAYAAGAEGNRDAYCLLNFIEYRAIVLANDLYEHGEATGTEVKGPPLLLRDKRKELEEALQVRRQQFLRGEDAPWAAFDIARGQHYLQPNVFRFLAELGVAVEDVRRVAHSASDRWMVETTLKSLHDLKAARYPVDGLTEAIDLLERAADEGWEAGSWKPLAHAEGYLLEELRQAQGALAPWIAAQTDATANVRAALEAFRARAEEHWRPEEEERFQKELEKFKQDIEPPGKKHLKVLWKLFGADALKWGIPKIAALALGGPLPAVGVVVLEYAAKYAAHQLGAKSEH